MIVMAYLRDGRVHASKEAYDGGDGLADYEIEIGPDGKGSITSRIGGKDYVSAWCWPLDTARPYGAVPLLLRK